MEKHEYILFSLVSVTVFSLIFYGLSPDSASGLAKAGDSVFFVGIFYLMYLIIAIPQIRKIVIIKLALSRFEKESISESIKKAKELMNNSFDSENNYLPYAEYSRYIQRVVPFYFQGEKPKVLIAFSKMKQTNEPNNILIVEVSRNPSGDAQILGTLKELEVSSIAEYIKRNKDVILEHIKEERLEKFLAHDEELVKANLESNVAKSLLAQAISEKKQ